MKTLQLVYQEIGEPGNSANSPKDTGSNNHDICSYPKKSVLGKRKNQYCDTSKVYGYPLKIKQGSIFGPK